MKITTNMEELKQPNIPAKQENYITEEQARAIFAEGLNNLVQPIRVLSGQITNQSGNVSITPTGTTITALNSGSMPSIQGWTSTLIFSATDADTVAWASGSVTLSSGTVYTISAGNTGNISAITYVYLDISVSLTVLQTTTTAATAVGTNKILIAVAQNNSDTSSKAKFQVFGGSGGVLLTVDSIAANSASTNEFISNTAQIKDAVISSAKIASLNADVINAGTITGRTLRTAAPAAGVGSSVVITGGTGEMIHFYYDAVETGTIKGYTTEGSEVTYLNIEAASGRKIKLKNSFIEINGDLCINANEGNNLGSLSVRWNYIYGARGRFDDSCEPIIDSKANLGTVDKYWADCYCDDYHGDGLDFAEMFESFDGEKILNGTTVVFENGTDKIRPAKKNEEPIGVISARPTIVGNSRAVEKFKRDDFGEIILNKDGSKKIIENYNNANGKKDKREMDEWNIVGLIGRVRIKKNQPVSSRWIKIRDISVNVEEWLIR